MDSSWATIATVILGLGIMGVVFLFAKRINRDILALPKGEERDKKIRNILIYVISLIAVIILGRLFLRDTVLAGFVNYLNNPGW